MMYTDNYLYHYGIVGMKWGVRRYQNPDGSYTPAGQKRYNRQEKKRVMRERKQNMKNRRILTDKDLDKQVRRLEQEKKLQELTMNDIRTDSTLYRRIETAKKNANWFLNKVGRTIATAGAIYLGKKILEKYVGPEAGKFVKVPKK